MLRMPLRGMVFHSNGRRGAVQLEIVSLFPLASALFCCMEKARSAVYSAIQPLARAEDGKQSAEEHVSTSSETAKERTARDPKVTALGTWSCAYCSLTNEEPHVSFLQQGGVVSCSVCLMVRGEEAWLCPFCAYMNANLKAKSCKICGSMAFGGKMSNSCGGSRSEVIARDYKRRKRSHTKSKSSATSAPGRCRSGSEPHGESVPMLPARDSEALALSKPLRKNLLAGNEDLIQKGQSAVFAHQLKTMHVLVRVLLAFPVFCDSVAEKHDGQR
ncbi:hypothetical protein Naga_100002g78 [Nannochloropsis gaditana]|uniref:RanBP2-type domain-containing protein n=1 Tax=Nannochloropsis gaditana TaxID=72520 RepID=W7TZ63_9STRA|nr:hypothetical protein Naga_100002g78 [Nannochloropsis gaditana]